MTAPRLPTRAWADSGLRTSVLGYGAAHLSVAGRPGEDEALALLAELFDAGVTLFDTADTYCLGANDLHHNERLLGAALRAAGNPEDVVVCTKGGTVRTSSGWAIDGRPDRLYRGICESYAALGERPIPVWQHHWPDSRYSIADMLAPVRRALDEGMIRHVGVCNYNVEQLTQARDVVPVVCVQAEFNFWNRELETSGLLANCERHELTVLPWRPLGGPGLAALLPQIEPLRQIAERRGVSCAQVTIAWLLAKSPVLVPIPGGRSRDHLRELVEAANLTLEPDDLRTLNAIPAASLPGGPWRATELPLA